MEQEVFIFPTSFAQQRLWFLDQWIPGSPVYTIPIAVRLTGRLQTAVLEHSLNEIIRRHEVLRTTFAVREGQPVQVITPTLSLPLSVVDLRALPETRREAEVGRRVTVEAQRPFDLAQGPLVRARLFQLGLEEYVLLLTLHHIIADGWSLGILFRELVTLYTASCLGQPSPLPELPIQYADFVLWQRQWLQGERLEQQLAYWKQQLHGIPPVLELPTDRPRPAVQSYRGARQSLVFPHPLSDALKALSRREGVTLFMTLLAAFQTLLHRYTGQDDVVVGSPIAGRTRAETEGLIGFFVNTLVFRTDLSGDPSFRKVLERVRETALGAYAHQDLPFEKLVEELHPERHLSRPPLFQVMFVLQNTPTENLNLPGLIVSPFSIDNGTAKFDVTLSMSEGEDGISGVFEYNTDLFEAATMARLLGHFQTLLAGIVANPEQRLWELPLLTEAERHQLLVDWNDTATDYPRDQCIHQLFEAQAEQAPDAVAVVCEGVQLTYQELNRRANQLAHYLRKRGIGPETLVGICVERSVEMIIGLLGILKAGAAYVPLDPTYPQERLAYMLQDIQAPLLLTQSHLLPQLPEHGAQVVCLDRKWEEIARESPENAPSRATADHLAYVIYTSGSTGRPKGVCIPHHGVVRLVKGITYVTLTAEEVFLQLAPLSFDASTFEIWGCLLNGARLVIFPPHTPSLAELGRALQQYQVTTLWLTAGLFHQMVEGQPESLRHVRQLLAGGDVLSVAHVEQALHQLDGGRLINGYGPTESTTFTCCYGMTEPRQVGVTVPIGRPIANTQVYVLDRSGQPVPIGVPGELYIGGDGLAREYLNQPQLTAERFTPHPFSEEPGARLYRTGDLVRYRPDGNIEFLGRLDLQVKLRGFRIELGEIETVLCQHPTICQTVAVAREDTPGDKRLVAYIVPVPGAAPPVGELRSFLKAKLPEYMVPSTFVTLDALPLTPNGKVDRQALPVPGPTRPNPEKTFVAPRDALELQLTRIWEQVLNVTAIGVRDNFFEFGGHSLLAVRLLAHIEKIFGKELPVATLFQAPTVEQLATLLRQKGWSTPWSFLVPLQPLGSRPPFFCAGGTADLARHLDVDQPYYGLQPHGLDGRRAPSTVEDMAADFLREIRAFQPKGPYFLGGWSLGGLVAFEVAQQLHQQGQELALLILIDPTGLDNCKSWPLISPNVPHSSPKSILLHDDVYRHLRDLISLRPQEKLTYITERVRGRVLGRLQRIERKRKILACQLYLRIGRRLPLALRHHYFIEAGQQAARNYVPRVYPGRVIFFQATKRPHDLQSDWVQLASGGWEVLEVPGGHLDIMREPQVQVLAKHLTVYLQRAQAESGIEN